MGGMIVKVTMEDMGVKQAIKESIERLNNPQKFLQEAGIYLVSSVQRNFQEQGRPVRWKSSARAIAQHGQTLRDTGRLMNSITMKVFPRMLKIGTNVIYAAIHHYGGKIDKTVSVKAHTRYYRRSEARIKSGGKWFYPFSEIKAHSRKMNVTIPARPYLMIQEEDWPVIIKMGQDHFIPVNRGM